MRVRLIIEKELEPFWGAEDLLAEHGGVVTAEFCKQLIDWAIMEDISSFIFPNGEDQYEPEIKLEVVGDKPLVTELRRTCFACPSQWEGATEDGEHVYIRYRWGFLSATIGKDDVYGDRHGDSLDGNMSDADMMKALSGVMGFSNWLLSQSDDEGIG